MESINDFFDQTLPTEAPRHVIRQMTGPIQISSIPKVVMQCGWDKKYVRTSQESINRNMGDWEYHYLSQTESADVIRENFPTYIDVYDRLTTEKMKCNFIAYAWLYLHGGVYLNPDYEVLRGLDSLFYNDSELYFATNPDSYNQVSTDFLASKPKCRFWMDMMDEIKNTTLGVWVRGPHLQTEKLTGGEILTSVLHKSRNQYIVISPEIMNKCGVCSGAGSVGLSDGYIRRLDYSLGATYDEKFYNFCWCNGKYIFYFFIGLVIILILIYAFKGPKIYYTSVSPIPNQMQMPPQMNAGLGSPYAPYMGTPPMGGGGGYRPVYQPFFY